MTERYEAIVAAALAWSEARRQQRKAKAALLAFRQQRGGCQHGGNDYGEQERRIAPPCWQPGNHSLVQEEWCAVCQDSQPFYLARKRAGVLLGKATRALISASRSCDTLATP